MCFQSSNVKSVPSVTLQTAVLMQVQDFAKSNQTFSVHDVTRTIRQKTGSGDIEIPEVEVSGASFRFDIPHTKVKDIFNELWNTGVFDPFLTLSRSFNSQGHYFEYTPTPVNTSSAPAPSVAVSTNPPTTAPSVNDASVQARITLYLTNCRTRNFRPTLKQVQSAIKRNVSTGWSCEKIQDYIIHLSFNIIQDPEHISSNQVATV
jgi:hypothetical protein